MSGADLEPNRPAPVDLAGGSQRDGVEVLGERGRTDNSRRLYLMKGNEEFIYNYLH